jgi:Tol biopolymer transport system component
MDALAQLKTSLAARYLIDREIGRGGMATVYLARDVRHARNVAVKVLNPELGAVLGVERFLSEIQVTANLQHPNLLPLFDSGEVDGQLFYVMPYVQGESLRARLQREKQLPVDEALQLGVAVAGALHYAHRHGVIHRDLKPENILLHEGQPLVADFGIALAVSAAGGERITQTGISLGTPHYMSPEQATGDRVVDQRSDIYSLGAVIYECLSGDPPHTASTAQAIIAKVLTDQPRSIRAARPAVSANVDNAINRALEKLPADRWKTAQEFADALLGRTIAAPARGAPSHRGAERMPPVLRSPLPWAIAFAIAAGIAAVALMQAGTEPTQADETIQFGLGFPPNLRLSQRTGGGRPLAISPDGRRIAYVAVGAASAPRLVVRSANDVTPRILEGTEAATQPSFSPDGNWIAFVADQQLKKVRFDGSGIQTIAEVGQHFGLDWGWSDQIVVSVGSGLILVPAEGGAPTPLTQPPPRATLRWPRVLDDGKTILVSYWTGGMMSSRLAAVARDDKRIDMLGLDGMATLGVIDDHLIYSTAGAAIYAVPYDTRRGRPTGDPIMVADRVAVGGTGAAMADMSDNGSLVFLSGSATSNLMLYDNAGAPRPLLNEARPYAQPRYSPNGRQIAVSVGGRTSSDVHLYDIASGTLTRLTTDGVVNDRAEWTPDSKRVLYRAERDDGSSIWWVPADQSAPPSVLLAKKENNVWEGVFAPDGVTLVYRTGTIGSADMYVKRVSGDTTSRPFLTSPFTEWCARVSPDGRWVAYSADDSRVMEVYVRPLAASGGRVQVSAGGGTCPLWSRDGRTMYYANNQSFWSASVITSPAFTVTGRRKLFEADFIDTPGHPNYDIGPKGEILMVKPTVGADQVIVIHNWRAELRERLRRAQAR